MNSRLQRPRCACPPRPIGRFFLGILASGCVLGCTSDDCSDAAFSDSIEIVFTPTITVPGDYRLEFTSGAVDGTCHIQVGGTTLEPCTSASLFVDGKNADGVVTLSTLRAWFNYGPPSFELVLENDESVIFRQSITPEYATDEPNGPGCGIRKRAVVSVTVF